MQYLPPAIGIYRPDAGLAAGWRLYLPKASSACNSGEAGLAKICSPLAGTNRKSPGNVRLLRSQVYFPIEWLAHCLRLV